MSSGTFGFFVGAGGTECDRDGNTETKIHLSLLDSHNELEDMLGLN